METSLVNCISKIQIFLDHLLHQVFLEGSGTCLLLLLGFLDCLHPLKDLDSLLLHKTSLIFLHIYSKLPHYRQQQMLPARLLEMCLDTLLLTIEIHQFQACHKWELLWAKDQLLHHHNSNSWKKKKEMTLTILSLLQQ